MPPMQLLLHGPITPAVGEALKKHGHQTHDVAELDLGPVIDMTDILQGAKARQWDVLTADAGLAHAPFESDRWFDRAIVFLQLTGGEVEQDDAIERLFTRYKRLTPRRLYTVTEKRVKIRQLPGPK